MGTPACGGPRAPPQPRPGASGSGFFVVRSLSRPPSCPRPLTHHIDRRPSPLPVSTLTGRFSSHGSGEEVAPRGVPASRGEPSGSQSGAEDRIRRGSVGISGLPERGGGRPGARPSSEPSTLAVTHNSLGSSNTVPAPTPDPSSRDLWRQDSGTALFRAPRVVSICSQV